MSQVYVVHGKTVVWPLGSTCSPKQPQLKIVRIKNGGHYKISTSKPPYGYRGDVQAQTCNGCEDWDWPSKVRFLAEAALKAAQKLLPAETTEEVWVELVD